MVAVIVLAGIFEKQWRRLRFPSWLGFVDRLEENVEVEDGDD